MRGFAAAAVFAIDVAAGTIAPSSGRPIDAPPALSKVRLDRCFFVMNIFDLLDRLAPTRPSGSARAGTPWTDSNESGREGRPVKAQMEYPGPLPGRMGLKNRQDCRSRRAARAPALCPDAASCAPPLRTPPRPLRSRRAPA